MTSLLSTAAQAAHSATTTLLSAIQITPGREVPEANIKETSPEQAGPMNLLGKNLILGVPGAFTGGCSKQIPSYIEHYEAFKAKGIKNIYVVAVNDQFAVNAWKEKLAPNGTQIRFMADDQGTFTSACGLMFDATPLLGGPRSKRYAMVVEDGKVLTMFVEQDPSQVTITDGLTVLAHL
ncbi:Redoxin-domain-containing protein [Mucidula mucida]|nr:Redoxin-domain-containing protein [Mucidula mucida]KAF8898295.1 Redoxin-domain-containing protein [Mucidula mucida]